jgi:hypothetical protein
MEFRQPERRAAVIPGRNKKKIISNRTGICSGIRKK